MDENTETLNNENSERSKPYVRSSLINGVAKALTASGVIWLLSSVAYLINGLTLSGSDVDVFARPTIDAEPDFAEGLNAVLPDPRIVGSFFKESPASEFNLSIWDSSFTEQLFARLDFVITGLAALAAALIISKLLRTVAAGNPFAAGNSTRWVALAGVFLLHEILIGLPSAWASGSAIERAGLSDILQPVTPVLDLFNLIVLPFGLLVLAEAFRRGGQLRRDVEGLI